MDAQDLDGVVNTNIEAGTGRVGMHAKVIVIDRKQGYIGSLNLDPRSSFRRGCIATLRRFRVRTCRSSSQ